MGDNDVIINVPEFLANQSLLFVPKRLPPSSLQSPSLGSVIMSDFNQKSNITVSPKDDWSAIVQPSISNRRLADCRTGSYNSFDSLNARINDLNSEYPTMRPLHSSAVSMWSLEDSVAKHISTNLMLGKNPMYESVIYPPTYQKNNNKLLFYKVQRKFSCPALFQLQDLSVDPNILYQEIDKSQEKEVESTKYYPTHVLFDSVDMIPKQSAVSPLMQTHSKNFRYKCESWLREIKILNFPDN